MSSKAGHQVSSLFIGEETLVNVLKAGCQVGKFIYRGRNTGERPQKLVTKFASLFIGEE